MWVKTYEGNIINLDVMESVYVGESIFPGGKGIYCQTIDNIYALYMLPFEYSEKEIVYGMLKVITEYLGKGYKGILDLDIVFIQQYKRYTDTHSLPEYHLTQRHINRRRSND